MFITSGGVYEININLYVNQYTSSATGNVLLNAAKDVALNVMLKNNINFIFTACEPGLVVISIIQLQ